MEDSPEYPSTEAASPPVQPLDDPDFIGAEVALKRAAKKAITRDLPAGLEPILAQPKEQAKASD